ncbi:MAG: hypothetical protein JW987_08790 [Anaerolineaceae bacterium]|nr:hypothetical protein [Anaerolineaceae bacterium]
MTTESDIRFITRYYESLRGLLNMPLALLLLALASQEFFPGPLWKQGDLTLTLPLMALMFLAFIPITRYYRKYYGSVQVEKPGRYMQWALLAIASIMLAGWIDSQILPNFPVSLYVLTAAVWMFLGGRNRRRWYYRVFAVVLALFSFYPAFSSPLGMNPLSSTFKGVFDLILGLGIGIVGMMDHVLLTRMLRPVQEVSNDQP